MDVKGEMVLGFRLRAGIGPAERALNPATGERLMPAFGSAGKDEVETACGLASEAFDAFRDLPIEERARFLESIAEEIFALGDDLIERAVAETGLPHARITGERGRTIGQLNLFASVVRSGHWVGARIDPALLDRAPAPRPDLRLRNIPLGPVAVFGASNFPLAFSVAGGDTASALAAGCPVIVKAHPSHPGTCELVGKAIQAAAIKCKMPDGVFSLIIGSSHELGAELVANPAIKAVGFTGSRSGGLSLMSVAQKRPEPIPVYAEMSSVNPVFLLPSQLRDNAQEIARGFAGSLTLGAGQFCTNPGLVVAIEGKDLDQFIAQARTELSNSPAQTMLNSGITKAYSDDANRLAGKRAIEEIGAGISSTEPNRCQARLFSTSAREFFTDADLQTEIFGAAGLIVKCQSEADLIAVANALEGQLTATMHLNDKDANLARRLLPVLERKAGRILCNAFPTGVEVSHAMVHGGPFPATSDSRTTSVGTGAIQRFLRPVCYQSLPDWLMPTELGDENHLNLRRLVNGEFQT